MKLKSKALAFGLALGIAFGSIGVSQNNNVQDATRRMHYLKGCNNTSKKSHIISKFLGTVILRPIETYNHKGKVVNKEWYGNVFTNGYRYINGKKYYRLAYNADKYVSAGQLNAHNSKNHPDWLTVYSAKKKVATISAENADDEGDFAEEPTSVARNQPIYRYLPAEKAWYQYLLSSYKQGKEEGNGLNGADFTADALQKTKDYWYVSTFQNTFEHAKMPDSYLENIWITPNKKKYFKRGGTFVWGSYYDRKIGFLSFNNPSIKQGYCWTNTLDTDDYSSEEYHCTINNTTAILHSIRPHSNLVKFTDRGVSMEPSNVIKVHLYI